MPNPGRKCFVTFFSMKNIKREEKDGTRGKMLYIHFDDLGSIHLTVTIFFGHVQSVRFVVVRLLVMFNG